MAERYGRRMDERRVGALLWLSLVAVVERGESQPSTTVTPGPPPSLVVQAPSPPAAMNAADRAVLLAIKAMNPDAVGALPNWDPEEEPCTSPWEGVACDVDGNLRSLCAQYLQFSLRCSVNPSCRLWLTRLSVIQEPVQLRHLGTAAQHRSAHGAHISRAEQQLPVRATRRDR